MAGEIETKLGSEWLWRLWHDGIYASGKELAKQSGKILEPLFSSSGQTFSNFASGWLAAVFNNMGMIVTMGGIAAVSAGTSVMDYIHEKKEAVELYRDEVAAKLKKSHKHITEDDFKAVAKTNRTLSDAIGRLESKRNINIAMSVIASLGSFGAVKGAIALVADIAPSSLLIEPVILTAFTAQMIPALAFSMAVGLAAYYVLKKPIRAFADKYFGYDKETAHEKIMELERAHEAGKQITREQVFSVFVSANQGLEDSIKKRTGREFEQLPEKDRHAIADHFSQMMDIDRFVGDINSGRVNVTELAFAVEGQRSGVIPKEVELSEHKPGFIKSCMHAISKAFGGQKSHVHVDAPQQVSPKRSRVVVEYDNPVPEVSFVERLGKAPVRRPSFVEQVNESRDQAVIGAAQQQA